MNRRHFLMSSAVAASTAPRLMSSPNDTVRVACVGLRGRGRSHIEAYSKMPNVEIVAFCDIDENILNKRLQEFEQTGKKRPASYVDVRKLLEDKNIDAISIATPNHSHTLQTIWACQAGKDVYIEKPACHNIFEGMRMIDAARK